MLSEVTSYHWMKDGESDLFSLDKRGQEKEGLTIVLTRLKQGEKGCKEARRRLSNHMVLVGSVIFWEEEASLNDWLQDCL